MTSTMAGDGSHEASLAMPPAEDSDVLASELAGQHELVGAEVIRARTIADALHKAWPHSSFEPLRATYLSRGVEVRMLPAHVQVFQNRGRTLSIGALVAFQILSQGLFQAH